jgi:hypothetical protein
MKSIRPRIATLQSGVFLYPRTNPGRISYFAMRFRTFPRQTRKPSDPDQPICGAQKALIAEGRGRCPIFSSSKGVGHNPNSAQPKQEISATRWEILLKSRYVMRNPRDSDAGFRQAPLWLKIMLALRRRE